MRPGHPRRKAAGCCPHCGHKTVRMEGTRIAFRLTSYDRDTTSELVKRLVGQATSSHGGKYAYRRKGLLDEIPRVRLIRGMIIVRTEDAGRVVALFEVMGVEVQARRVYLVAADIDALRRIRRRGGSARASK